MPGQKRSNRITEPSQYISIAQTNDKVLANDCQRLLCISKIDATIEQANKHTYILKVQERRFNEAYIIIHSRLSPDGFFDMHKQQ